MSKFLDTMKLWQAYMVAVVGVGVPCYLAAIYFRIQGDNLMNTCQLFGTLLALLGFPFMVTEFKKLNRGFISVDELQGYPDRIKNKVAERFPAEEDGRQGTRDGFDLFFCLDDAADTQWGQCLKKYYGQSVEWSEKNKKREKKKNYYHQDTDNNPGSGIRILLDSTSSGKKPFLVCLSRQGNKGLIKQMQ